MLAQRYYDPAAGRFLARDPSGYAGGMNLYGYCGNGPVSFIDPSGLGPQPGQDWGRNLSNLIAGVGYGMSLGLIEPLWHLHGTDIYIDRDSPWFYHGAALGAARSIMTAGVTLGPRLIAWVGARLAPLVMGGAAAVVTEGEEEAACPGVFQYDLSNLQHEYYEHGADFGVTGNRNNATRALFSSAIQQHVSEAPEVISGTYRGTIPVTHYFESATNLWVGLDPSGRLVAGWTLGPNQVEDLLKNGNVR